MTVRLPGVCNKHLREHGCAAFVEGRVVAHCCVANISFLRPPSHGDRRAIHVHLPITDFVEPSPRQRVVPRRYGARDAVLEGSRGATIGSTWAATFNTLDNDPLGVFRGLFISGKGNLARPTAMSGAA